MNVTLAPGILDQVIAHARRSAPNEGCGLLYGHDGMASRFVAVRNIALHPLTEYEMDPPALIDAFRRARVDGEQLVAIFHSHPAGSAKPSKSDVERALYPEAAHLIVSLAEPERPRAAAFRIVEGEVIEVELHAIV